MRPVKHWTTPTIVVIDMLLDGILEVVSVYELLCDFKGGAAVITHKHCPLMTYCVLVFTTVLFVLTGREVSNRHESHFCSHGRKMSLLVQLWNQRNAI